MIYSIQPIAQLAIEGQTCSGTESKGIGYTYTCKTDIGGVQLRLSYEEWGNGERDINCLEASGHPLLATLVGRMRLEIGDDGQGRDFVTFRTAVLKHSAPPHATLCKRDLAHYRECLNLDLGDILGSIPGVRLGTKEELLNRTGRERTELCVTFPRGAHDIPLRIFILTRALALLNSNNGNIEPHGE